MIRGVDLPGLLADLSHALDLTGAACAGRAELFDNVTDPAAVAYRLNQARGTARAVTLRGHVRAGDSTAHRPDPLRPLTPGQPPSASA